MGSAMLQPQPAQIVACTISRDVQNFDLLIEDMEVALGESWGDLGFHEAMAFFKQSDAEALEFVAVAVDDQDEEDLSLIGEVITGAKEAGIKVILIAEELSPIALHQLLRLGADDFVPYPLPENELNAAIERLRAPEPEAPAPEEMQNALKPKTDCNGIVLPVHGLAGGSGASTFAVNLAWELCIADKDRAPRVCLLDFDLQFGAIATYLDLPRREAVYEMLADTENMDSDVFMSAILAYKEKLHVLTCPSDILPLDMITPEDVERILDIARANFDFVIVAMPTTLVAWTETVLNASQVYFSTLELDMRSAQNVLRLVKALKSEDLPVEKLRFVMNRSPKFTDLQGKARVKRMAESLDIKLDMLLPDGGKAVMQAGDHGSTLAETAPKNPLRKEIQKLAASVKEMAVAAEAVQQ